MEQSAGASSPVEGVDDPRLNWRWKLCFKDTFIDVEQEEASLSPRASSDPGSLACGSERSYFDREEQYIQDLSEHLAHTWRGQADAGEPAEAASSLDGAGVPVRGIMPRLQLLGGNKRGGWDRKELQCHIKDVTREVEESLFQQRRASMLSAIQEIPEQVGDALQKSAVSIVDDVIGEVAVVRSIIQDEALQEQTCIDRAVAKLEVIPEMIQDSFVTYFARAERTVRRRVDDAIMDLEGEDLANEQAMQRMMAIPAEVQEIAKQAMQGAVAESRAQAQQQIGCALAALPGAGAGWLAGVAEGRIVGQVPVNSSHMIQPAKDAAAGTVEHVVATVMEGGRELPRVANQVVAETLLRAKVSCDGDKGQALLQESGGGSRSALSAGFLEAVTNAGSAGHPELCARPCLYFAKGDCCNGQACSFCHHPHPKRPVHPDRRHRELLREMSLPQSMAVLAPVLRQKVEALHLGPEAARLLEELARELAGGEAPGAAEPPLAARQRRMLLEFLNAMTLRSVLALLLRAAPNSTQRDAVERFLSRLRDMCAGPHGAIGRPGDAPAVPRPGEALAVPLAVTGCGGGAAVVQLLPLRL